ncbi:hypothetical protein GON26_20865 [Flavobacterium sp. GA093]|uniref:Uncharacterized protein n=1 Tax=Flavobacterium hydrocarbonoxydans TaxID=2683249 RepID=A0A6I4NUQ4_9FLAO|nr:hypothetical protein [Flavobacterium hydrocarbonoxydans]MWB96822.1 hypothetical protein [Flavobacterium hydrocarbonoxydans]
MLTPSELERRKRINLKVIKFGCLPIIIVIALIVFFSPKSSTPTDDEKKTVVENKISVDTLISQIKKDPNYKVKEIFYRSNDNSLNIVVGDKDDLDNSSFNLNAYFSDNYKVYDFKEINTLNFYDFKKGKLPEDYLKPTLAATRELDRKRALFLEKYPYSSLGFYFVERYLKQNLGDPSSLIMEESFLLDVDKKGTFATETIYRAKNEYGVKTLYTLYCDVDKDENMSNIEIKVGADFRNQHWRYDDK